MKRDTLKYIGLGLIAVVLVFANTMMVYKTFFAKNRLNPDYKNPVKVTNEDIRRYADSVFVHRDSLRIVEDDIMSNKRIIIENGDTVRFAFIVYEPIPCPSCSDVNYVLLVDNLYTIKNIVFLREIVENYKIIQVDSFRVFSNQWLYKNILKYDFNYIQTLNTPKKYSKYFKESVRKIQGEVNLFYEK
jgi:hypothetical protein